MSASQWLWLAALSVLWGGSFFFTGYAVREIDAVTLVFFRVALAALVLLPLVYARGLSLPMLGAAWIPFAVMAILNNVIPFTSMALGQARIESGLASVINATTPVWSVLLLHLFTADERLTWNKFIGVLLGAGGVAILIGPAAFGGLNAQLTGILFLLITTGSYGCAAVWGRRLRGIPPVVTAASQLTASAIVMLPLVLIIDQPFAPGGLLSGTASWPSPTLIGAVVALAVISTACAYLIFFHILSVSGPANAMLVTLLIPISGIALGALFLDETLLPRHFIGFAVIATALIAIDGRLLRSMRPATE